MVLRVAAIVSDVVVLAIELLPLRLPFRLSFVQQQAMRVLADTKLAALRCDLRRAVACVKARDLRRDP